MMKPGHKFCLVVLPILFGCTLPGSAEIDFERDIRPIFSENCHDCHGAEKQKGELRLDRLSALLRGGNSGEAAVVPGNATDSFLVKVIRHEEPDLEMPPKGDPLTAAEIELIEKWITEGAETPQSYGPASEEIELTHWSFVPVRRPDSAEDIDGFIQKKLTEKGLTPSPAAERRTLIRRLHFIMLGLPPTPERVAAFVADTRPDAWELLVEEVLASPHYGERWATHWLDLVRFGETHGFETNRERPTAWHYRDWVIDSFNRDKPYDQFVREQIAGDALGQDVATSFLVAGPFDSVKGQDPKLRLTQRMNELDDMINTTGTAFLGLTTGCARCHNHKFDPISQKDYYSMQAVFAGVQHGDRALPLPEETKQRIAERNREIAGLTKKLKKFVPDGSNQPGKLRAPVNSKNNEEIFPAREAKLVRFTINATSRGLACIDELEIFSGEKNVALASAGAKASSSGDFEHPIHKLAHINDGNFGNEKSWITSSPKGGWVQIEFPETVKIDRIVWGRDRNGTYVDRVATDYRIESATKAGEWKLLASSADRRPFDAEKKADSVYEFSGFPEQEAQQGRQWFAQLNAAKAEKAKLEKSMLVYAGKFEQPGPTHRLYRGEPEAKRERVGPDAIEAFASLDLDADAPEQKRRAALADWIASKENPLTARVVVNRLWQFHFGTGIVDTPSDFGKNGTPPSHPELLDWLAVELMENGWSLKHIHRLLLHSQTWRQDNRPRAGAMKVDAGTRLLWRFPARRMEAEGIRDAILTASGVLDLEKRGGPGFSPFEVEAENVRHYHPKTEYGPEDWRRMIYMTKVRQEREAVFGAFDCPDASMVVPKRSRSTTPLQALNLLNSSFVLQQADLFATRLKQEAKTSQEQIHRAWQLCFSRAPSADELDDALAFIEDEGLAQFTRAMLNANEFVFIP
jgi:hypothetical protein